MGAILGFQAGFGHIRLMPDDGDGPAVSRRVVEAQNKEQIRVENESRAKIWREEGRIDRHRFDWFGGLRATIPEDALPKQLFLVSGTSISEYIFAPGSEVVSERFRRVVEEFDPGVHQFVPVEVLYPDGRVHPGGPRFFMFLRNAVNAVHEDSGELEVMKGSRSLAAHETPIFIRGRTPFDVDAKIVSHLGLWRDVRMSNYVFASDAFLARLRQEGIDGWREDYLFREV